ncbi:MAG: hypothetical protein AB1505_11270 [Candidatus Latescibacterota bacterium]
MKRTCLALACAALLGGGLPALAGEARVTQVRGSRLTVDAGSAAGLAMGMEVTLVRPPGEPIIHPITGENLGAPELALGRGLVTKASSRAASVDVEGGVLMVPRAGDVVRFASVEEEMVAAQEQVATAEETHRAEHKGIGEEIGRLAQGIKEVQGRIGSLEKVLQRIERVEEGFRVQLRGLNQDMTSMREDIRVLKEQVALYTPPTPVKGIEEQKVQEPGLTVQQVEQIVQDALGKISLQAAPGPGTQTTQVTPAPQEPAYNAQYTPPPEVTTPPASVTDSIPLPDEVGTAVEPPPPSVPFWQKTWFLGGLGALGILAVAAYLYLRMSAASKEDEEEEDEEVEEDEEEGEEEESVEVEAEEEEDDIVVEDTSR